MNFGYKSLVRNQCSILRIGSSADCMTYSQRLQFHTIQKQICQIGIDKRNSSKSPSSWYLYQILSVPFRPLVAPMFTSFVVVGGDGWDNYYLPTESWIITTEPMDSFWMVTTFRKAETVTFAEFLNFGTDQLALWIKIGNTRLSWNPVCLIG